MKQRILLINYEYPPLGGGAGNATAHIARHMAGQGREVLVATSAFRGFPAAERVDGYQVRRIPTVRRFEEKCAAWEMAVFMTSACVHVPLMARSFRPDAAVAFFGIPSGPSAWILRALRGVPYLVSLRGGDVPGFQPYDLARMHRLTGPVIRFLWKRAGAVVPNSNGLAGLARAFEPGLEYPVIPNGADTEIFRPREEERREGPPRMFFHGRVVFQKGLDVLLEALGRLPRDAAWELHIAGDGPQRPELEARARALGMGDRVVFRGWMRRPELARTLRDMDLLVFPSRDEGMPNAVLEAMASGLPVVATRIAGNEELVLAGLTGMLTPPESPEELAGALAWLLGITGNVSDAYRPAYTPGMAFEAPSPSSPPGPAEAAALRKAMGRAGRERVERNYSWESVAARYLALLDALE